MDVVIGAAFGDEGKGLITHYLASEYKQGAIVVRFNGGAQAGHTVQTEQGQRHVFKHLASGTFAGCTTYLSRFFVSNPILFLDEIKELSLLGVKPRVYVDPDSPLTTPYDMMINQMAEEFRDKHRHGSCGVGFAETIERSLYPTFSLTVADLDNMRKTIATLKLIQKKWLPHRLASLNIAILPQWQRYIESDDIFQLYIENLSSFLKSITVTRIDLTKCASPIIFEGAQGLMLDQEYGWFPHVTRSNTGLKNVVDLVKGSNKQLNVIYVTRSYLTRHGAGPLPHEELFDLPYKKVIDKTNTPNNYQGSLRYAWFNLSLLKSFIKLDLNVMTPNLKINHRLALTCLDQVDEHITYVEDKMICQCTQSSFLEKVANEIQVSELLCSYGPTINTLMKWQK